MLIMMVHKIMRLWPSVLLGLFMFYFSQQCDARAVNVSNTWTMPPEGLNVFYRFFRDRISWFEADAVCQFHHANLVTVDNSFQFDATRDLLRELDVNDIVWIGLMRPQNSERFMWSNSHPLVADTGYWAESLPLMDSPLCAVIDPIRDYRWHALRCGGPETASFLCEMPVPSWADVCIIKDMPNLTMQYMADTASIELIRNCQEEGLLRQSCKSKEDRELAMQQLICPKERLEAQRINEITNSHFKSLQIINSIRSDNNENNNIELLPMEPNYGPQQPHAFMEQQLPTEKNTVQRLIETFNVDELMQADTPYKIPAEIPKPVKKSAKKVNNTKKQKQQKTDTATRQIEAEINAAAMLKQQQKRAKILSLDDMMLGDQPMGEPEFLDHVISDEVSNEIIQPLPHQKKMQPTDLRAIPSIMDNIEEHSDEQPTKPTTQSTTMLPTVSSTTLLTISSAATDTTTASNSAQQLTTEQLHAITYASDAHSTTLLHAQPTATIGHPMHPQQPRGNVFTEETQHPHIKESPDNSHFIPPMLMVKSHYVPQSKHGSGEHYANDHHMPHATAMHSTTTRTTAMIHTERTADTLAGGTAHASVTTTTATGTPVDVTNGTHDILQTATTTLATLLKPIKLSPDKSKSGKQQQQVPTEAVQLHDNGGVIPHETPTAAILDKATTTAEAFQRNSHVTEKTTTTEVDTVKNTKASTAEQRLSKRDDIPTLTTAAKATTAAQILEDVAAIAETTTAAAQDEATTNLPTLSEREQKAIAAMATANANNDERTEIRVSAMSDSTVTTTTTTSAVESRPGGSGNIEEANSDNDDKTNNEHATSSNKDDATSNDNDNGDNKHDASVVQPTNVPATITTTIMATTDKPTTAPVTTYSNDNTRATAAHTTTATDAAAIILDASTTVKSFVTATPIAATTRIIKYAKTTATAQTTTSEPIPNTTHDFLKDMEEEDNLDAESYRPNRRRALTKPDTPSYLKKILG